MKNIPFPDMLILLLTKSLVDGEGVTKFGFMFDVDEEPKIGYFSIRTLLPYVEREPLALFWFQNGLAGLISVELQ